MKKPFVKRHQCVGLFENACVSCQTGMPSETIIAVEDKMKVFKPAGCECPEVMCKHSTLIEEKQPHPKMGLKSDSNKPPISIIPREAIEQEAQAFAFGANKYGKYNFRNGIDYTRLIDAAQRHILAFSDGEDKDPESGVSHLAHARANLAMLLYMIKHKSEHDDRYKPE